jgi:(p)ppGpp synthase/HD superfamily hydrolase
MDKKSRSFAQALVNNLNYNVLMDHIEYVEEGIREIDDDYYRGLWLRQEKDKTGKFLRLTPTLERAIATAAILHRKQLRKGSTVRTPYISHLLSTAEILAKYTSDELTLVAGVLHDSIEDVEYTAYDKEQLERDFGKEVTEVVLEVTEDVEMKLREGEKASWEERKKKYIQHLKASSTKAMMISCADKIHNLKTMIKAYKEQGDKLWKKFNSPIDKKLWFYWEVLHTVKGKIDEEMVEELEAVYEEAEKLFRNSGI